MHPPLDYDFMIYRYRRVIEEELAENQNTQQTGSMDMMGDMSFQQQMKLLQSNIEKAALLHMEFWS